MVTKYGLMVLKIKIKDLSKYNVKIDIKGDIW